VADFQSVKRQYIIFIPFSMANSSLRWWRPALVGLTIGTLLLPGSRLPAFVYPLAFGVPLAWAGFRPGEDRAFRSWTVYALGFVLFALLRAHADEVGFPVRWSYPITFDGVLGRNPSAWLQAQARSAVVAWSAIAVHLTYYAAPPLMGLYVWRRLNRLPRYTEALLIVYAVGLVIHAVVPTAPPWLAAEHGYLPGVRRLLFVYLYPDLYRYGVAVAGGNDVAAMPSVHTAAAAVIAAAVPRLWFYPVAMGLALVYLGEHYVVDVLAGVLLGYFAWKVAPSH
jgi:hypothetical protein